jgi:hypothetical protein
VLNLLPSEILTTLFRGRIKDFSTNEAILIFFIEFLKFLDISFNGSASLSRPFIRSFLVLPVMLTIGRLAELTICIGNFRSVAKPAPR